MPETNATDSLEWEIRGSQEKEQWAWLAGIIDGEGAIGLGTEAEQQVNLQVSMTHQATIERLREITNVGYIVAWLPKGPTKSKTYKKAYKWQCKSRDAVAVLRLCLPWLYTKKEEALIAIEYMNMNPERKRIPASISARRMALRKKLMKLHARSLTTKAPSTSPPPWAPEDLIQELPEGGN